MNKVFKHISFLNTNYFGCFSRNRVFFALFLMILATISLQAQVLTNSGAAISVSSTANISCSDFNNNTGSISNNGKVYMTGNWNNSSTHTPGAGTVGFNGTGNQYMNNSSGETFNKLVVANSGGSGKRVKLNNRVTIDTSVTVSSGVLQIDTGNFINKGITEVSGTIIDSSVTGKDLFKGLVTVKLGGTWDFTPSNTVVEYQGGLLNAGTFKSGTGDYNFTSNPQSLTGTSAITFSGNVNVDGAVVTAGGTINMGCNGTNVFAIKSGSFNTATSNFTAYAKTYLLTTLSDNNTSGSNLFADSVIIKPTSAWNFSGGSNAEFHKGLNFYGSVFNSGTGSYIFNTNNQNIVGSSGISLDGPVSIGGITLTNKLPPA